MTESRLDFTYTAASPPQTIDADAWARDFVATLSGFTVGAEVNIDLMRTWFANAIMAGFDTATNRARDRIKELEEIEWKYKDLCK